MTSEELKKIIDQGIREALATGIQSGKQETSGLVAEIMHKIEKELDPAIKRHVNGQFNDVKHEFQDFKKEFQAYAEQDEKDKQIILKWQTDYSPYLDTIATLTKSGKMTTVFIIAIGAVCGAIVGTIAFVREIILNK